MKIAVITGTAQGIGAACAAKFHQKGYQVIGVDIKDPIESQSAKHFKSHHIVDTGNSADIKKFAEHLSKEISELDVLVRRE